ncbi:MAG: YggS family pyridoxal phosphate-dependent enzyme [Fimbriimonadaceae bacterium]
MGDIGTAVLRFEAELLSECEKAGRSREDVTLVAVSKTVPVSAMLEAYDAGLRHFGESRLQEALPKLGEMPEKTVWHFIGRLQSNKARSVAENFDVIHALTNERQLEQIAKADRRADVLVQVNIACEESKDGIPVETLDKFIELVQQCEQVRCRGLTVIAPLVPDPEQVRWVFREAARRAAGSGLPWLSMGMSGDWRVALQEGATHLRVGSALFGER